MENEKQICPHCQSTNTKRYAYGLRVFNSPEKERKFYETNIMAGCVISDDAPVGHCADCKKNFGRLGGKK